MPNLKASDIGFGSTPEPVREHNFRDRGEQRYSLELLPIGITFEVDRLSRRSHELWGELSVSVNGSFPHARTIEGGLVSIGDLNFSSVQARTTRAKLIADRSRIESLDWHGFLEEFAVKILAAERKGRPATILAEEIELPDTGETWDVDGFPLLVDEPTVVFGLGESAKSYFAMYLAGELAMHHGVNVLYADWEFSVSAHRKRLGRLFQPMPKNVFYARCERPLEDEIDRLIGLLRTHSCRYVVCDSMMFALAGRADEEQAGIYFRACRRFKVGSLHLAHTSKGTEDGEKKSIFGSVFFQNGARSIWFIQRVEESPRGEIQFGLYHHKNNLGQKDRPKGYRLLFRGDRTVVERVSIEDVDELEAKLPLLDRMKRRLRAGAMTPKALAEAIDTTAAVIRKMYSRHQSVFVRVGDKIGLIERADTPPGEVKVDF